MKGPTGSKAPRSPGTGTASVRLLVHVQPRAGRTEVAGTQGDAIKVRVHALPADGAANQALLRFLSSRLELPGGSVRIATGIKSRRKEIEVVGLDRATVLQRLGICEEGP